MAVTTSVISFAATRLRWRRYPAAAGIAFVISLIITIILETSGPDPNLAPAKVASDLVGGRMTAIAAAYFLLLDIVLFLVFIVGLRRVLQVVEGEDGLLSTIGLGASMIGLALVGAYTSIFVSLAGDVARVVPPSVTYAMFRTAYTIDSCSDLGFGGAMIAFSLIIARTRALAPWTGWFGIPAGLVFALGALSIAGPKSGPFKLAEVLGTLLFAVWIVGTSISMWRSSGDTPEPSA